MTSTAVRSTPNLTVPSTQNTAPVLEFRCLYTHDLRRKSKRWQDGFLRFHTFNKRVMVYDVPRNFIGDMHLRSGGTVEDGDELELEKGVLVQVGEGIGSMEQDLTALFERRRVTNESPPAKKATALLTPCLSSGNIATAPVTQLRPKSLNALLGTPRGRYGRAMLPTVSPFEERQQANKPCDPEENRSVKRRKMNPPPLNTTSQQSPSLARARRSPLVTKTIPTPTPRPAKPSVRRQEPQQPDIIEVGSSDEETSKPKNNSVQPSLVPTPKRAITHQERCASPLFCSSSPPVSTTNHLPPANPVTSKPQTPTEPSAAKEPAESEERLPVNPLRPAARKPRQKLMYKNLLPPKRPPSDDEPGNFRTSHTESPNKPPAPPAPTDELSTFHQAQRKRLDARMRKLHPYSNSNPSRITDGDEPLRFSDEGNGTVHSIALPLPPQQAVAHSRPQPRPPGSGPIAPIANDNIKKATPRLPANTTPPIPHTTPKPPPRPPTTPSTHHPTLPLRRSDSAPNPSTSTLPTHPAPPQPTEVPHLLPVDDRPAPLNSKAKAPLRKCTSLTLPPLAKTGPSTLAKGMEEGDVNVNARVRKAAGDAEGKGNGTRDADRDRDVGPWSREAGDLLAWTRPGATASASTAAGASGSAPGATVVG